MYKKTIQKFLREVYAKDQVSDSPAASAIADIEIKMLRSEELAALINESIDFSDQPERVEEAAEQRAEIQDAASEQLIKFMRKGVDHMNRDLLIKRISEYENEIIPQILKMLKTSLNDSFIEESAMALSLCGIDIADELVEYFDEVRSPYAQSMIFVILGFKAHERHIPWIIEKYYLIKKLYQDSGERYHEGAWCALEELEARFYY